MTSHQYAQNEERIFHLVLVILLHASLAVGTAIFAHASREIFIAILGLACLTLLVYNTDSREEVKED